MKNIIFFLILLFPVALLAQDTGRYGTRTGSDVESDPAVSFTGTVAADSLGVGVDPPTERLHIRGGAGDTEGLFETASGSDAASNIEISVNEGADARWNLSANTSNNISLTDLLNSKTIWQSSDGDELTVDPPLILTKTAKTLSSGAVTMTSSTLTIDTEGGAALDTLTTLTAPAANTIAIIRTLNSNRDVRILNSGNFILGSEITLNGNADILVLISTSAFGWLKVDFSDNN